MQRHAHVDVAQAVTFSLLISSCTAHRARFFASVSSINLQLA
jgi:hypothetical protein